MSTRRRNIAVGLGLGITGVAFNTYFVHWTASRFDLSGLAEIVLGVVGGVCFGLIAGYIYIELETARLREKRDQEDLQRQARLLLERDTWRRQ